MLNFWGKRASGYGGISLTKGMFPVHLNKDALLRHQLVLGTTGSGKTEYLLALAEAQIGQGAGLVFVDGKESKRSVLGSWVYLNILVVIMISL